MKIIQFFLSLIFLIIVCIVLILSYFGFIPIISDLMGVKLKDLGIKYDQRDYQALIKKVNEKKEIYDSFSQEELSSSLNNIHWKYLPINNTQIRINNDGTVEFSANILTKNLFELIAPKKISQFKFINLLKNPPVYMKFEVNITNNKLNLDLQKIELGKLSLPMKKINISQFVTGILNDLILKTPGLYIKSIIFSQGQVIFQGSIK